MSCRQSKVVTSAKRASAGSGSRRASWNVTFGGAAVLLGAREGVLGDVPAVERRARKGLRHLEDRDAGAAADVGDLGALLQALDQPGNLRQRERDEHGPEPRSEAALDGAGALGAEGVVGEPDPAAERLRQARDDPHHPREMREEADAARRRRLVGQDRPPLGREGEAAAAPILEHARRTLLAEPLPDPALGAPGARRQLCARQRSPVGQRPIETEPVPQVDHGGGHRPAERAEDELRVGLELLEIDLAGHGSGDGLIG
jgi:hypothetical protein